MKMVTNAAMMSAFVACLLIDKLYMAGVALLFLALTIKGDGWFKLIISAVIVVAVGYVAMSMQSTTAYQNGIDDAIGYHRLRVDYYNFMDKQISMNLTTKEMVQVKSKLAKYSEKLNYAVDDAGNEPLSSQLKDYELNKKINALIESLKEDSKAVARGFEDNYDEVQYKKGDPNSGIQTDAARHGFYVGFKVAVAYQFLGVNKLPESKGDTASLFFGALFACLAVAIVFLAIVSESFTGLMVSVKEDLMVCRNRKSHVRRKSDPVEPELNNDQSSQ